MNTTLLPKNLKIGLLGAMLYLSGLMAGAQNNSLLHSARNRAAQTPPAGAAQPAATPVAPDGNGAPPPAPSNPIPTVAAVRPQAAPSRTGSPPIVNPMLAQMSHIAVVAPEPEKIKVHDLVTIIVREDKQATTDAKADTKKDWQLDSTLSRWFRIAEKRHLVNQARIAQEKPGATFDFEDEYKTSGQVNRKDSLITRIQATVIDVKPNGNLVLEAKKEIEVDDGKQIVTLTGVCRGQDVTPQNTVLSTQVADLKISAQHTGAAHDATQRGWLKRGLDWAKPF